MIDARGQSGRGTAGHLMLIFMCQYNFSPNLGMIINARQVPVFTYVSSLMHSVFYYLNDLFRIITAAENLIIVAM